MWEQIAAIVAIGLLVWFLFWVIRRSPEMFTAAAFSKSLTTMGLLALVLIVFIGFCVLLLRA